MVPAWQTYVQSIRLQLKRFRGSWPPNSNYALGDFGQLINGIFHRRSNLKDAYLAGFSVLPAEHKGAQATYHVSSSKSISISAEAAAHATGTRAHLKVKFGKEAAVLFNAAGCRLLETQNYEDLGNHVVSLWQAEKWDDSYYVVTTIVEARTSLALMSNSPDAEASIEAIGDVPHIDLTDAKLKLKLGNTKSLALDIVTLATHTPLIGLSKLNPWWFTRDGKFDPSFIAPPEAVEDTLKLRTELLRGAVEKDREFQFTPDEEA